jgi:hypothetical protein
MVEVAVKELYISTDHCDHVFMDKQEGRAGVRDCQFVLGGYGVVHNSDNSTSQQHARLHGTGSTSDGPGDGREALREAAT